MFGSSAMAFTWCTANTRLIMKRIGIISKQNKPEAIPLIQNLVEWLRPKEIEAFVEDETGRLLDPGLRGRYLNPMEREEIPKHVEMVIVLGGDGTLLSVARQVWNRKIRSWGQFRGLGF
jgi:NAD+ kinase